MEVSTGEDKAMPGNPLPRRTLGRTGLEVSVLGFGSAPVGDLYREVGEAAALETIVTALSNGVTLLDTSPFYGSGLSEHRVGSALRHVPEVKPIISTKVGRYALPSQPCPGSSFAGGLNHALQIDYGYDGVMRSIEQSLLRLGVNHLDIVLVHDLDRYTHGDNLEGYYQEALEGAVKALTKLRNEGVIRGYGVGVNEADMAERFARDCDPMPFCSPVATPCSNSRLSNHSFLLQKKETSEFFSAEFSIPEFSRPAQSTARATTIRKHLRKSSRRSEKWKLSARATMSRSDVLLCNLCLVTPP